MGIYVGVVKSSVEGGSRSKYKVIANGFTHRVSRHALKDFLLDYMGYELGEYMDRNGLDLDNYYVVERMYLSLILLGLDE